MSVQKNLMDRIGRGCSLLATHLLLGMAPSAVYAMTPAQFDALGDPQYQLSLTSAECAFGGSDSCQSFKGTALQGTYTAGVITMENSEDLGKQKFGVITLTFDGAFPNEPVVKMPGLQAIWTNGEPGTFGVGEVSGYHPLPNTFQFVFSITPQPKSEVIDLTRLVLKDWTGANWGLSGNFDHLTSVSVATNCIPMPIPEPETYVLMLASMGVIVGVSRRQHKASIT